MTTVLLNDILDPKRNNFTLLRLLAALAVVVSHAVFLRTGNKADEIFAGASVYNLGDHAVNVFFVLSGLTVAASLDRSGSSVHFLIARLLRIFPGLIVCTALLVTVGIVVTECSPVAYLADARVLKYVLKTVSLSTGAAELPGVFSNNPHPSVVNASLWTLKFELLCYVLLASAGAFNLFRKRYLNWLLPIGFLLSGGFLVQRFGGLADPVEQMARFWLCFSIGVGFFVFRSSIRISWIFGFFLVALMAATLGTAWDRVISPVATGYAAVLLGSVPLPGVRQFTNKVDLSYGVYIFGWPISQTLILTVPGITTATLIIASCGLALSVAVLSWHLVEKPSLGARTWIIDFVGARLSALRTGWVTIARQRNSHEMSPAIKKLQ